MHATVNIIPRPRLPAAHRNALMQGELRALAPAGIVSAEDRAAARVVVTGFVFAGRGGSRAVGTDLQGLVTHVDGVPLPEWAKRFPSPLDLDVG